MRPAFLFPFGIGVFFRPCSLEHYRQMIDLVDDQLCRNLELRMSLSKKIARQKMETHLKIDQSEREAFILDRLRSKSLLSSDFVERVWTEIFQESKRLQKKDWMEN